MNQRPTVVVWDLPTRVFHWTLAGLVALQYASGEFGWLAMEWHYRLGYATLALIVFRALWGFAGSATSRFAAFVRGPRAVARYVADALHGRAGRVAGHNPIGGWSVLLMLASVALQAASGLFSSDDISEDGPLVARVSDATVHMMTRIHHLNRYALAILIVLHIGAVLLHRVLRDDDLVAPMLHGRAQLDPAQAPRLVSPWRALVLLAVGSALVWGLVTWGAAG